MKIKTVRHYVLRDYRGAVTADMTSGGSGMDRNMFENYVAFVSLLYHPAEQRLYCGVTAFDCNILARFNPATKQFEKFDYRPISEPFEVKVHRSLELASDGTIYGATACLHGVDKRKEAPGGWLFKIKPGADRPEKIAIPIANDYIQTITLDEKRKLIYGLTYPVFNFFVYHLDTGEVENHGYMGSITHISAIDDAGCFWSTWDVVNHNLFKYDPATRKIAFFQHGVPNGRKESNMMYPGAGPVDCMINGGDGYIYIGTTGGSLCRLNPKTAEVTYLGKPSPATRMPGLLVWRDSLLMGTMGDENAGCLFAYDRDNGKFIHLGNIVDSKDKLPLYRTHDLRLANPSLAYVAETDTPGRSGYLWECEIEG
jgi:hypothetical protein